MGAVNSHRISCLLLTGVLVLAACGGGDDASGDDDVPGAEPSTDGDSGGGDDVSGDDDDASGTEPSTDGDSGGDGGSSGDGGDSSEGDTALSGSVEALIPIWSVPVNGAAGGSTIALSPDGSQVAFMTGGLAPMIQIHDAATGDMVNSAEYHGQGIGMEWTADNQLVSWGAQRLHLVDAASLVYPGAVDLTIAPGAEECPSGPFSIVFDRASNAMLVSDFHDTGTIVCRLDIGAATITSTIIEGVGSLGDAFLRPEANELVVAYSVESILNADSVAVLDATTLEVKSSGPTSTGEAVSAATATDLVVGIDRVTDGFASTGQPIAAQASGDRFGRYLVGIGDSFTLVLMDATTGQALFTGSEAFRPIAGTDDGSKIAVLLSEALEVYTTN